MSASNGGEAVRLGRFFAQFGDMRQQGSGGDLRSRLEDLFAHLWPLLGTSYGASGPDQPAASGPAPDEAGLRRLFAQLAGPLEQARRDGALADVWSIAGLGRNEVRNAAALAALWNPRLCGTAATAFLAAFLARLGPDAALPTRAELDAGYLVRTEDRPEGAASERIDITVEGRTFLLGLEIKIDAAEGPQQLSRYRQALQARAAQRGLRPALVYLSPRPPEPGTCHARWADVAAAARAVLPPPADRRFVHQLLAQFATHISTF